MRISSINEDGITFDNGYTLRDYHNQSCCENNYADWKQLEDLALDTDFNEDDIVLESCYGGFRFGNPITKMFFIPCYSEQNGYYSSDVNIEYRSPSGYLCGALNIEAELLLY